MKPSLHARLRIAALAVCAASLPVLAAHAQALDLNRAESGALYNVVAYVSYTSRGRAVNTAYCRDAAKRIVAGRPYRGVEELVSRRIVSKALFDALRGRVTVVAAVTPTPPVTPVVTPVVTPGTPIVNDLPFPRSVDLGPKMSPVRNQARRNTCNAFATTAGLEAFDKTLDLSEQLLYYLLRFQDGDKAKCERLKYDPAKPDLCDDQCSGVTLEDAVKVLQRTGLYSESAWTYDRTDNLTAGVSCNESATWASKVVPVQGKKTVKLGQVVWLTEPGETPKNKRVDDPMVIMAILAKGYAVNIAIDVAGHGWSSGTRIDVELDPVTHKPMKEEGGHGLLLVGYDYDKKVFKFKNSWDTDWADQGYGYLTFDYLKQYVYGGYYVLGIVK